MADQIQILTPAVLHAQARGAAEQGVPLCQANHHEAGTPLWHLFNNAYRQAVNAAECISVVDECRFECLQAQRVAECEVS